jgi:methionyl-tRNA formyltransferase
VAARRAPTSRRIVFLGTPEIAATALRRLHDAGHDIALVVTNPDRRRGRGGQRSPSPVKATAIGLGLDVSHDVDDVVALVERDVDDPIELGVVVAFGQILRAPVLAALPLVNLHFSLLPRWRGAAPVERAILAGDPSTGVCVMRIEEGLDTGPVYGCAEVPISASATLDELRAELVDRGSDLLLDLLERPTARWIDTGRPQVGEPVVARKLTAEDRMIDVDEPAELSQRRIRLGGAWLTFRDKRLLVHAADVVDGRLVPRIVQPEGKAPMPFSAWRNGARPGPDEPFGWR